MFWIIKIMYFMCFGLGNKVLFDDQIGLCSVGLVVQQYDWQVGVLQFLYQDWVCVFLVFDQYWGFVFMGQCGECFEFVGLCYRYNFV